jgi:hypothetical protein
MSLQIDIDISCNGVDYVLKVQPQSGRKIAALQALGVYPGTDGGRSYCMIESNLVLSALLEIVIYQGAERRQTIKTTDRL